MRFDDTVAKTCRWSDEVYAALGLDGREDVLWESSEANYQGHADLLFALPEGKYLYYKWTYGSCSGCDAWEDNTGAIASEVQEGCLRFDNLAQLKTWGHMLRSQNADVFTDDQSYDWHDMRGLIQAIERIS